MHGGATMLKYPGSMYSGLPLGEGGVLRFRTAQADSYTDQEIDLLHPAKSMGVIGYIQQGDTAVTTCRKMPCQAQVEFRNEIVGNLLAPTSSGESTTKTLTEFTRLLRTWNGLLKGDQTMDGYMQVRKQVYEALKDPSTCGEDLLAQQGITNEHTFQNYLNTILNKAAEQTLDRDKITQTKNDFMAFLKDVGIHAE